MTEILFARQSDITTLYADVAAINGTLAGQALTAANDTNVTLTLGGAPTTALLTAASLTLGWTGTLSVTRGGTGANLSATGGTSQVLKQTSSGGAVTVAQLAASDLSNGVQGSGAVVLATSPSLTTPTLGAATATTINKVTITAPASSATLTIATGKTLTANNSITIAGTDAKTLTVSNSLTLAGTDGTTMTFPGTSDTVVTLAATQTLTNKTIASSQIKGTTTNDNAASGVVGEYLSSTVLSGSAVPVSNNTPTDITNIALTAGDWEVWGSVYMVPTTSTATTVFVGWINTSSATLPTAPNAGAYVSFNVPFTVSTQQVVPVGRMRVSLSGSGTIYLSCYLSFTGGTGNAAAGFLAARRIR